MSLEADKHAFWVCNKGDYEIENRTTFNQTRNLSRKLGLGFLLIVKPF